MAVVVEPRPTAVVTDDGARGASFRRLSDAGGVTSSIDPTTKLRSGCLARHNGYPSEEMPTSRPVAA